MPFLLKYFDIFQTLDSVFLPFNVSFMIPLHVTLYLNCMDSLYTGIMREVN